MTMKTFYHYDPGTGEITARTVEHVVHLATRKARGEPVVESDMLFDPQTHRVNLETLEIEPKS